jgi:hypothetical protein
MWTCESPKMRESEFSWILPLTLSGAGLPPLGTWCSFFTMEFTYVIKV